jgi:multicomponent Na+:H+ antiporter subunit E
VKNKAKARYWLKAKSGIFLQFGVLFLFWLILSGHYKLEFILFGVASAALVTFLTHDIFAAIFHHEGAEEASVWLSVRKFLRFLAYMPWLLYQIIKANIQVASIVLNPKMPIDPAFLQFNSQMKRNVAHVILATSITLTPGTITMILEKGRYTVHALVPGSAGDLVEANMQNKIGAIFMEAKEPPPDVRWAHSLEELLL